VTGPRQAEIKVGCPMRGPEHVDMTVARSVGIRDSAAMIRKFAPIILALALTQYAVAAANAQLLDQLKSSFGSGQGMNPLAGGSLPAVNRASPSNIAGVLQYCMQNQYIAGGSATAIKDALMSRVIGAGPANSQFNAGTNGMLVGGGGSLSLDGGGTKEQMTKKVCELVLQHARSLL
jgi:hypothetical protein